jgi:membrane protein YqaA with SNARE-associated domain
LEHAKTAAINLGNDRLLRKLAWQSVGAMGVMFGLIVTSALLFRQPISTLATAIIEHLGVWGIFVGVIAADGFTFPIPPTTYLFVAVAAGAPVIPVLAASAIASLFGGAIAYTVGPALQRLPFFGPRIEAFRPRGEALFKRWGVWTIAVAALTPLPYSVICYFAGIYKMPFKKFFVISLVRAPRLAVYLLLFTVGWHTP